jgi:glutamate dehydrogenase/leucine dehydrogenase
MTSDWMPESMEGHEQVSFFNHEETGLQCIVAIHSRRLGPGLGGLRVHPYTHPREALDDVLRLSKGMTLKAAAAGLCLGGAKAVIIGDPKAVLTPSILQAYADIIDSLGGRYITAEDLGTSVEDMDYIRRFTKWTVGTSPESGGSGDPSPATARGVLHGIRASVLEAFGDDDLPGRSVAIQGVGKVGATLAALLKERGARVLVADKILDRAHDVAAALGLEVVSMDDVLPLAVDVFSPCAVGGIIDAHSIETLRCKVVAGAANNQLETGNLAGMLKDRGIVYAPDFLINAGGLIQVAHERHGLGLGLTRTTKVYDYERAMERVDGIFDLLRSVFEEARRLGISTHEAAVARARKRLAG